MRRRSLAALPALVLLGTGCWTYSQVDPSAPPALAAGRSDVRLTLTDAERARMAAQIGPPADYLDGRVTALSDSTYTLAVHDVTRIGGVTEPWKGESVTVTRAGVAGVQIRRFSAVRTALLVGGAVAVSVLGRQALNSGTGSQVRGGGQHAGQ